jgi:nucleotide-binding universal stress UspA family protein
MKIRKILFPTDFSHTGDAALAMAESLARDNKATIAIVHVVEPPSAYVGEMYYGIVEPNVDELKRMLSSVKTSDSRIAVEHSLIEGEPADAICRFAKGHNVDLIVLGTHGRKGISRLLMGSVTEAVVRRAECPVLVVRQSTKK